MSNPENESNAKLINEMLQNRIKPRSSILDICCGAYSSGTNYDPDGEIYEPVVAQYLAAKGYDVIGLDFRTNNKTAKNHEQKILYKPVNHINLLTLEWVSEVQKLPGYLFEVAIFVRSWDTPELLFSYQNKLLASNNLSSHLIDLKDVNLEMALDILPKINQIVRSGGYIITSEIFHLGLDSNSSLSTTQILEQTGWKIQDERNGLFLAQKSS